MSGPEPHRRVRSIARVLSDAEAGDRAARDDAWAALDVLVAVFDVDDDGGLSWSEVSPAQERALGVSFETLRGRGLDAASPLALEAWVCARAAALVALTERAVFDPEHPDADTGRWVSRAVTPVRDERGAPRRLVVTSADVTEQHRLAALLAQATRADALGHVAGDAAHEFNNLMVAISGYAGLALRALPGDGRAREQLVEVLRLADAASSLTRQMLAFTRRQEGPRSLVRLDALAAGMERVLRRVLSDGVSVAVRGAHDLWAVKADPHQIEQVLLHLAAHAREAMPRGGALTLEAANVTLSRDEARALGVGAGDHVRLAVRDTGDPLDPAVARRLGESNAASVITRSDVEVGLATCHGVVRRHGGALTVTSATGQGTEFRIHLPRAVEKGAVSGVTATARLHGTETVLVADPGASREAAARTLRMLGYAVLDAPTADEALRLVEAYEGGAVHLVVLGVAPAQPASVALLRAVRARDGDVPVLVTAADETSVLPIALVSARVVKLPASLPPTTLARRVRQALDERARGA